MTHDHLKALIERYTPRMLDVIVPATDEQIERLESVAGSLPEDYRDFLGWMGNSCPFLEGEALAYSPDDLLEFVYEDPEIDVPPGFIWMGVDKSGSASSIYLRLVDGAITRADYYDGVNESDMLEENVSLASFLLTSYVRKTLAPSLPHYFSAALRADGSEASEVWSRIDAACKQLDIPYPLALPDFRFYGGNDFVVGVHQRARSAVVYLQFGAVKRSQYEAWYDLVFDRWGALQMPE